MHEHEGFFCKSVISGKLDKFADEKKTRLKQLGAGLGFSPWAKSRFVEMARPPG